jgi:outer membrane receptor protein involved in Fe transport
MRPFTNISRLFIALAVAAVAAPPPSVADEQVGELSDDGITVKAQPLATALQDFSEQSGLQVAYVATLAENVTSKGAHDAATPAAALSEILDSTGLEYQFVNDDTVAIGLGLAADESGAMDSGKTRSTPSPVLMAQKQTSATREPESQKDQTRSKDEAPSQIEEILVTGSRIRGAQSASPVMTVTRDEIDRAGFATVEELLDKLPQNFGAGGSLDTLTSRTHNVAVGSNIDNIGAGYSVNLRGLGASSTLILLNGRRMSASGFSARFTDISGIPVSAVERVEVLTDGASAIYGSDAIAGVVNFILRDDYEGAETRLRYGSALGGDTSEGLFGQSFGASWDDGNILLSYEYYKHDNLANSDHDFVSSSDLRRFGGSDWRVAGGNPANVTAGDFSGAFAIPAGQDGTSLTAADFDPGAPLNLHDIRAGEDFLPEQERHSTFVYVTQAIGAAELFAEGRFSTRETRQNFDPQLLSFEITDANPFFVDPSGTGLTNAFISNYSPLDDLGPEIVHEGADAYGGVVGVKFGIGEAWNGELAGSWSREEDTQWVDNEVDPDRLADALNQTDPDMAFNPFADGSNTNPDVLRSLRTSEFDLSGKNEIGAVSLNVDGSAFDVPGGAVKVAAGVEFREESLQTRSASEASPAEELSRNVTAVYTELFLPLVRDTNNRPGVRRLDFSLAARYENYSDFGDTINPKFGIVWSPIKSLTLRGAYGTSFRAPALFDLTPGSVGSSYIYLPEALVPLIPFPALVLNGANEELQAEEATTWTTGFQWNPENVNGLSLNVTYFDIDFEDRIDVPFSNLITGIVDPRFASLLNTTPTAEQIASVVNSPRYQESVFGFTTPAADILSGAVAVGGILDRRKTNLSKTIVTGLELQLSYVFETALGSIDAGLNSNYLFDFERQFIAGELLVDEVDTLGRPVDFRARGNVTWSREEWTVAGFINYVDGYTDNVSDPMRPIESWTTVDLTVSYETDDNRGFLSDTTFLLTTQNLFNEDPPFADTFGGFPYDSANANGIGQIISFQISKEW